MFIDWKTILLKHHYYPNLQNQCNSYQKSYNDKFCRSSRTHLKCLWNLKGPKIAKTVLKKETNLKDSHFLISKLTMKS